MIKALRAVASVIILFLIAVSVFAFPIMFSVTRELTDVSVYEERTVDEAYFNTAMKSLRNALEEESKVLEIDVDGIMAAVDEEEFRQMLEGSVTDFAKALMTDSEYVAPEYENKEIYDNIVAFLSEYAEENSLFLNYDDVDAIYGDICATVSVNTQVTTLNIAGKIPSLEKYTKIIGILYIPLAAFAVLTCALFAVNRKTWRKAFYNWSVAFVTGALLTCIPAVMWYAYDLPSRLILNESLLRHFVEKTVDSFNVTFLMISAAITAVAVICAAVSVVMLMIGKKNEKEKAV